jgi:hypothetical protein
VPSARLTALMTTALREAGATSQVELVANDGLINVSGRFAPEGKGYRLTVMVRSPAASKSLAFEYKSTAVGEAGALMIAQVIVREAQKVAVAPRPQPRPSPAATDAERGAAFDDESNVKSVSARAPVDPAAPNSLWVELAGAGLGYSINYERRFFDDLGVRAGVEYLPLSLSSGGGSASSTTLAFPIGVSYLGLRSGKHGLEAGAGVTLYANTSSASAGGASGSASSVFPLGWVQVGYRYHPVMKAGFNFRIGVMALVGGAPLYSFAAFGVGAHLGTTVDAPNIVPWGYISLGASF